MFPPLHHPPDAVVTVCDGNIKPFTKGKTGSRPIPTCLILKSSMSICIHARGALSAGGSRVVATAEMPSQPCGFFSLHRPCPSKYDTQEPHLAVQYCRVGALGKTRSARCCNKSSFHLGDQRKEAGSLARQEEKFTKVPIAW